MIPWKLIGGIVVVAAIAALALWVRGYVDRAEADHASAVRFAACQTAVAAETPDPKALADCGEAIAWARVAQIRAGRCDEALGRKPPPADRPLVSFEIDQACSTPVKTLVADRNARAAEAVGHLTEISRLRTSRAGDIARAESRAGLVQRRREDADVAKRMAPVGADGLREYRGDSLRVLAGEAGAGPVGQPGPGG